MNKTALAVGNAGAIIVIGAHGSLTEMKSPSFENFRAVRWNANGSMALIAGNNGTLIKYAEHGLDVVNDGRANLRGISWRKNTDEALITSNCFGEEFIPSPNLFLFDAAKNMFKSVGGGRLDLIGVDWNPDGSFAVVVGYDVVWHNGFIGRFDGSGLSPVEFQNSHVYPVAARWDPTGRTAAIATSVAQPQSSEGRIMLWDGDALREIYRNEDFFFSNIAWSPVGFKLAAVASTEARTFDS
jgi:WD40 repeat protein